MPPAEVACGCLALGDVAVGGSGSPPPNGGTSAQLEGKRSPAGELCALLYRPIYPQNA